MTVLAVVHSQLTVSEDFAAELAVRNPKLATIVNGQSIDDPYIKDYLQTYNYFSDIPYFEVPEGFAAQTLLKAGNSEDNIRGLEFDGKRFAIHLISCDHSEPRCAFRINGVASGSVEAADKTAVAANSVFTLDATHDLKVNSITYNFCHNKRFCNIHYEAYDIVNVSVVGK